MTLSPAPNISSISKCVDGEEVSARVKHCLPSNVAGSIGCRASGIEHAVVGNQLVQSVEVPAIERIVEPQNGVASFVIHPQ
jgi:hypothetical protein